MARKVYSVLGALVLVLLVVQFFLGGLGVFTVFLQSDSGQPTKDVFKTAEATFGVHAINGITIFVSLLVMLVCSFIARNPWRVHGPHGTRGSHGVPAADTRSHPVRCTVGAAPGQCSSDNLTRLLPDLEQVEFRSPGDEVDSPHRTPVGPSSGSRSHRVSRPLTESTAVTID